MPVWINEEWLYTADAHVHTFPEKIAAKAVGKLAHISGITPYTDGTLQQTKIKMAECGVDHAVLLNIATAPGQEQTINRCAAESNSQHGLTALGSVHFLSDDPVNEVHRIKTLGLAGVKLHPDYQDFIIDDERLFPIYEACAQEGLPIVFHAGWDCYSPNLVHAPPERSAHVAEIFPSLKIVLAHFGGLKQWDEVERYLIGKNVWFDTAMCATYADKEQIRRMILSHDPTKIMLGSDCPWENPRISISWLSSLHLPQQLLRDILFYNAQALFGFELPAGSKGESD